MPLIRNEYWVRVEDLENTDELTRFPLPPLTFPILVGAVEKSVVLEVDLAEFRSWAGTVEEAEADGGENERTRKEARRRRRFHLAEKEAAARQQKESEAGSGTGPSAPRDSTVAEAGSGTGPLVPCNPRDTPEPEEEEEEEGEPSTKRQKTGEEGAAAVMGDQAPTYFVVYAWFRLGDAQITVPFNYINVCLVLPGGGIIPINDRLTAWIRAWHHRGIGGPIDCGGIRDPFPRCVLHRRDLQTANGVRHLHHALHHSRRYIRLRVEGQLEIPQPVLDDLASPQNYLLHPIASGYPTLPDDKPRRSPTLGQALFALVEKEESREGATFRIRCRDIHVEAGGREVESCHEFFASRDLFLVLETPEYFQVNNLPLRSPRVIR